MSLRPPLPATSGVTVFARTPNRKQNPLRLGGSKTKRIQVENACTLCRKKKSKCDGTRPACSLCQELEKDCEYDTEEGESRRSALHRKIRILEAERDEARGLLALIQSGSEAESQDVFRLICINTYDDDTGASLRRIRDAIDAGAFQRQGQEPQQEQPHSQQSRSGSSVNRPAINLPRLRSVIDMLPVGSDMAVGQPPIVSGDET